MATIAHVDREAHQQSVRALVRLLQALHLSCDRFFESRGQMKSIEAEREQERQRHPEYAPPSHRMRMEYLTVLIGTPAVLLLDFVVLNSTAEYLASSLFPSHPNMLLLSRIAVPVCIFGIELVFAHHAYGAYHENDDRLSPGACGWALLGFALAACVAASVFYSMMALQAVDGDTDGPGGLAYGLSILAFIIHCSIVLGGGALHQAKGYLSYRQHERALLRRLRGFEALHVRSRREATESFLAYLRQVNLPTTSLGEPATAGPFSKNVRSTVNEIFGTGTIPEPTIIPGVEQQNPDPTPGISSASAPTRSPVQSPSSPQVANPAPEIDPQPVGVGPMEGYAAVTNPSGEAEIAGENEYMRQILERIRLQQDEEVHA